MRYDDTGGTGAALPTGDNVHTTFIVATFADLSSRHAIFGFGDPAVNGFKVANMTFNGGSSEMWIRKQGQDLKGNLAPSQTDTTYVLVYRNEGSGTATFSLCDANGVVGSVGQNAGGPGSLGVVLAGLGQIGYVHNAGGTPGGDFGAVQFVGDLGYAAVYDEGLGDIATGLVNSWIVPEPGTMTLMLMGLSWITAFGRRRRQ